MSKLSPSLRKAAVLISALDDQTADALLRQMSADDAAKVRAALVEIDDIPSDEQQDVLAEFFREQDAAPAASATAQDDVSLDLDPAVEAAAASLPLDRPSIPSPPEETPSFEFLQHVDAKAIALLLSRELPQTVAVVVAHLPAHQAAAVLQELPAGLATDALERTAWLDELSPEIQADLIRGLRRQLAPHIRTAHAGSASLAHLTAVLGAMDYRQRQRVVLQLGQQNASLLGRLGLFSAAQSPTSDQRSVVAMRYRIDSQQPATPFPPAVSKASANPAQDSAWLGFDDLLQLDDTALRAVFAAADTEIALLALTGAEPKLIARILRKLPSRQATVLRRRLEHPGPLRLRDVEQARAALAAIASRLAHEGSIHLPASMRFAAAV